VSMILVAGTLPSVDFPINVQLKHTLSRRRDCTQSEEPHNHVDQADQDHTAQQTMGANRGSDPFIDTSARDAANAVAIRAHYDHDMAVHAVAMMPMPTVMSFAHVL